MAASRNSALVFESETELIQWLRGKTRRGMKGLRLGIGDDAALVAVRPGHELILTTDLSIEGVHFLPALHSPRAVGHRSLARSLSDVAAMGGIPRFALVSLALSPGTPRSWVKEFYSGILSLARRYSVALVGGDTAVAPERITVDVTLTGEVERGRAVRRNGARPGDLIFVSGRLGLSALGLQCLQARSRLWRGRRAGPITVGGKKLLAAAIQAHLYPEPRCDIGRFLSQNRLATSLIDLSDGLSSDLTRLCQASGVGARVFASRIPAPENGPGTTLAATDAMNLALHGGEDYELLFTVPPGKARQIPASFRGVPLTQIGGICRGKKITFALAHGRETSLAPAGFDHFRKH